MTIRYARRVTVEYDDGTTAVYTDVAVQHTVTQPKDSPRTAEGSVVYTTVTLPESKRLAVA